MDRVGDQLFAHPGFPLEQHGGVQRGHLPHPLHHFFESEIRPDNFVAGHTGQFLLQIAVVVRQSFFECFKLLVVQRIAHGDGKRLAQQPQPFGMQGPVAIGAERINDEHADALPFQGQGQAHHGNIVVPDLTGDGPVLRVAGRIVDDHQVRRMNVFAPGQSAHFGRHGHVALEPLGPVGHHRRHGAQGVELRLIEVQRHAGGRDLASNVIETVHHGPVDVEAAADPNSGLAKKNVGIVHVDLQINTNNRAFFNQTRNGVFYQYELSYYFFRFILTI